MIQPYKSGDFIIVQSGAGTVIAQVVEDCHYKLVAGKVKHDYVRVRVYYRRTQRWCKTVTKAYRVGIKGMAGISEIQKVVPYHRWLEAEKIRIERARKFKEEWDAKYPSQP